MPNPRNPNTQSQGSSRPPQGLDTQDQDAVGGSQRQGNQIDDDDLEINDADNVEIGDPVPESDRTIRARAGGQGETGEDEDLPDDDVIDGSDDLDDDGIEGSSSDRH